MKYSIIIFSLGCLFLSSCNKKELDLEIVETACRDFFLSDPIYTYDSLSTCGNTANDKSVLVSFNYEGDKECLFSVVTNVKFYDIDGNELTDVVLPKSSYITDNNEVSVGSGEASFSFCYSTTSSSEQSLNYIQMDLHTENEQGNKSNDIGMRINIPGAPVNVPKTFDREFTVDNDTIDVFVFDDAAEDGDIISINVNQKWEVENKVILKKGENIQLIVKPAQTNFIMFYAVNQGTSGPNTLAGTINDGFKEQSFDVNLKTGETAYYKITLNP